MKRRLVFFALAAALCACNPQAPASSPSPSPSSSAAPGAPKGLDLHVTGQGSAGNPVRFVGQGADNRVEYQLLADRAESAGAMGHARVVFRNARITFHDKNGTTLDASAPEAVYDQALNTLTLRGGVKARTQNGMSLQCDELQYDHAGRMLHGRGHVAISDPQGFSGKGDAFDSDISLTHYRMQ